MGKASEHRDEPLAKMVRFNQLLDLYGALLTERQRRFSRMHFEQDLSFAEIAREAHVSRQAVHDAVKHARMGLDKYEKHLGLLDKGLHVAGADDTGAEQALEALARLRDRLRRTSGVIYSSGWITEEVERILAILRENGIDV